MKNIVLFTRINNVFAKIIICFNILILFTQVITIVIYILKMVCRNHVKTAYMININNKQELKM
jgi:hypothetical protein